MTPLQRAIAHAARDQYPNAAKFASQAEALLYDQITRLGVTPPLPQYKFAPGRKFAFDFAWPHVRVAVEVEGAIWKGRGRGQRSDNPGGGHSHPLGILRDIEKSNLAAVLGWRILRFTPDHIRNGEAVALLVGFPGLLDTPA